MRVLVVAEYYPRAADPVLGVWAHRQALAARDAGADVRVLVLYRPVPPLAAVRARDLGAALTAVRQPRSAVLDGIPVTYVRYLSPPRGASYGGWGRWAAPALRAAVRTLRREFPFDLVHAHNVIPAGDAVRRCAPDVPLVVSVHGGDLYGAAHHRGGAQALRAGLRHARLVLANSAGTAARCSRYGARNARVVHLGTDVPTDAAPHDGPPTLVTVANLIARKRHADVVTALSLLRDRHPALRYEIVGDGPQREPLRALAAALGVEELLAFRGRLVHAQAVASARRASIFVLPSVDEAFGVAYIEAMGGGVPAIGCRGEDGPEEIAAAGGGISLVAARDAGALAQRIDQLLSDRALLSAERLAAHETVLRAFTWQHCGQATVAAYNDAVSAPTAPV